MGRITQKAIDFANGVPIVEVYNRFVHPRKPVREKELALCPFHDDHEPSMSFYTARGENAAYCHSGCCSSHKERLKPINFVKLLLWEQNPEVTINMHFPEAVRQICEAFGYDGVIEEDFDKITGEIKDVEKYNRSVSYTKALNELALIFCNEARKKKENYFDKRGLSRDIQKKFDLGIIPKNMDTLEISEEARQAAFFSGLCKDGKWLVDRAVIPVKNSSGFIKGWITRATKKSDPLRYKNSPTNGDLYDQSKLLFNWNNANKYNIIIVVEGPMDCLSIEQLKAKDTYGVVALMGSSITDDQIKLLQNKKVCLALDNDAAGIRATCKIIREHKDIDFKIITYNGVKDANEALVSRVHNFMNLKEDLQEFLLDTVELLTNQTIKEDK